VFQNGVLQKPLLHNDAYLDDTEEEHDKNEDGVDQLVEPQLGIVVDNSQHLLRRAKPAPTNIFCIAENQQD